MKIGVFFDDVNPESGGASVLTRTVLKEIDELSKVRTDLDFVFLYPGRTHEKYKYLYDERWFINVNRVFSFFDRLTRKIDKNFGTTISKAKIDSIAAKEKIDIIWFCSPCYMNITIPYIYTVWDLGHRTVPYFKEVSENHSWQRRENEYSQMLPRASWIITGNEMGKREILENYCVPKEKIVISPFPISDFCKGEEEKPIFELPSIYFFYPAQFWSHKNHIVILQALSILKKKHNIHIPVFLTGADKGNRGYIEETSKRLDVQELVHFTGFLSSKEMKYMYTHATAMIYASLMGPNNLPPIEATYLHCPVIITDIQGHKEQLEDTALYFNGTDEEELVDCMLKVLDVDIRQQLINKQKALSVKLSEIKYCTPIIRILDEYKDILKCWKYDANMLN